MSITKQELIDRVWMEQEGVTKDQAKRAVDTALEIIKGELARGGEVRLAGFGTFTIVERDARSARNPRTGDVISIPPRKNPRFKPSAMLKKMVNGQE